MKLVYLTLLLLAVATLYVQHASAMPRSIYAKHHIARQVGTRFGASGAYRPNLGYHSGNGGSQRAPAAQHLSVKNAVGSIGGGAAGGAGAGGGNAIWPTFGVARPHTGIGGFKFGGMASGRPAHGNDFVVVNAGGAAGAALSRPHTYGNNNAVRQSANALYLQGAAGGGNNGGANNGIGGRPPLGVYQSG